MSKAKCAYFEGRYKAPHPIYSNARVEGGGEGTELINERGEKMIVQGVLAGCMEGRDESSLKSLR